MFKFLKSFKMPRYTIKEISKHNTKKDLWIIINDNIYDVTDFLLKHPGGEKILLKFGGKNATIYFNKISKHDDVNIKDLMKTFYIGKVK